MKNLFIFLCVLGSLCVPTLAFSGDEDNQAMSFSFRSEGDDYYFFPDVTQPWPAGGKPAYKLYSPRYGYVLQSPPGAIRQSEADSTTTHTISQKSPNDIAVTHKSVTIDSHQIINEVTLGPDQFEITFVFEENPQTKERDFKYHVSKMVDENGTKVPKIIHESGDELAGVHLFTRETFMTLFGKKFEISPPSSKSKVKRTSGIEACPRYDVLGAAQVKRFEDMEAWMREMASVIHTPDQNYFYVGAEDVSLERDLSLIPNPMIVSSLGDAEFRNLNLNNVQTEGDRTIQVPSIDLVQNGQTKTIELVPGVQTLNHYPYKSFMSDMGKPIEINGRSFHVMWSRVRPDVLEIKPVVSEAQKENSRNWRSYFFHIPGSSRHDIWNQNLDFWRKNSAE